VDATIQVESMTRSLRLPVLYLCRPFHGLRLLLMDAYPAMNRWAISDRPLRGLLGFQSRRGAAVAKRENRPAKANRPAMILIREEEPLQRVGGAAGFG